LPRYSTQTLCVCVALVLLVSQAVHILSLVLEYKPTKAIKDRHVLYCALITYSITIVQDSHYCMLLFQPPTSVQANSYRLTMAALSISVRSIIVIIKTPTNREVQISALELEACGVPGTKYFI